MAPGRPIRAGSPSFDSGRRRSLAGLASSFAASLADPSPLAQELVARDLEELTPDELAAEVRHAAAASSGGGAGLFRRLSRASVTEYATIDAAATDDNDDDDDDDEDLADNAPYLYRRPSGIAFATTRGALGPGQIGGPTPLSKDEVKRSREAERSLLRDNHLLPPKHHVAASDWGARAPDKSSGHGGPLSSLYQRLFSTKVPRVVADEEQDGSVGSGDAVSTEQTALLGATATPQTPAPAPTPEHGRRLDDQWEAAVAAGQIHTTWQREAKTIAVYSRSLIITFLLQYSINITGVFAVGHIGKTELGAISLAAMTASITFYAPCQGLATCLDTLCAQAYGSGHKTLVGLQLQRMCCFLLLLCVPLAALWVASEQILTHLVPERATAALAGQYLRILVLSMPASAVFECSKRYMQAQGLFTANTYVLFLAAPLSIFLNWLFVWHLEMGFIGAPISAAITQWTMPILLLLYVLLIDGSECWGGFSKRVFSNWGPMISLALPGMVMIEAEFFAFEILTLAAGRFGTTDLAAQSILVTITSTTFQIPFPMSIAASTRVANLVGAKLPDAAKTCAKVATVIGFLVGLFNLVAVATFRYQIPTLFTDDPDVIDLVARAIPICAFMQVFDGCSAVASGLLRGVGRQEIGSYANLAAYYVVALPISFGTAFGLDWQLSGLWLGVTVGLLLVSMAEFYYLYHYNWNHAVAEAEARNASG